MRPIVIAPSILSADFARLAEEIARIEAAGADWIHVDVMDGHFVQNLTIGPPVVRALKRVAKRPLDVHIMIENPELYAKEFCDAGASSLTFHVEAAKDARALCEAIREMGVRPGVAFRPKTRIEGHEAALDAADVVLIMTVEPGFGGQRFMSDQMDKVAAAHLRVGGRADIEVDGGIDDETAGTCARAGANAFVAGTYIFRTAEPEKSIPALRGAVDYARNESTQSLRKPPEA
jgi:ribulose-phosphate 3-epimerase